MLESYSGESTAAGTVYDQGVYGRQNLGDILQKPTENKADPAILDPDINEAELNIIYEQVAGFPPTASRPCRHSLIRAITPQHVRNPYRHIWRRSAI